MFHSIGIFCLYFVCAQRARCALSRLFFTSFSFLPLCILRIISLTFCRAGSLFLLPDFYAEKCCLAYVDYSVTFIIPYSLFIFCREIERKRLLFFFLAFFCCCLRRSRRRRRLYRVNIYLNLTVPEHIICRINKTVSFCFNLNFDVHASCQWLFMSLSVSLKLSFCENHSIFANDHTEHCDLCLGLNNM